DTSNLIPSSLDGTWKMVLVKDNVTGSIMSKPASLYGDVIITFVSGNISSGAFNGNTPTNDLGPDSYTIGDNNTISIPVLSMTKVAETSWGLQFVGNIRNAKRYVFAAGELLDIITSNKILTFEKV
ncbi:MAG: hypothetical protein ABJA90_09220, partial [Ginsengibacter sp.]